MARMYPSQVSSHTKSQAERLLFRLLREQLPDSWIVMHGVGWLTRTPRRDERGEADFVIVHPERGVLVLEVKGGRIQGNWSDDTWFSIDGAGRRNEIKHPLRQAERSMWNLGAKLKEGAGTRDHTYYVSCGVAFPDMLVGDARFGLDVHRSMILDSSDLHTLAAALQRMIPVRPAHQRLSPEAVSALVRLLQPVVEIDRPGLLAEVLAGEATIIRLTEEQRDILGVLQHQRRAVIDGCAGSGKTMLAIEKAIQLAADGFEVLLTCYNRNLSAWMASVIARQPVEIASKIRVSHYHDLAVKLCEEAGMPSHVRPADQAYWNDELPEDLLRALPHLETRFDAIVADEGQDFADAWWITLTELLRDPDDGVFYIFQDERQDIYRRRADLPFPALPFALQGNMRNTATIHAAVTTYYDGDPKPRARGPLGRDVERIDPGDRPLRALLRDVIHRLVALEGLRPEQLVILTPHAQAHSAISDGADAGDGHRLTWDTEPQPKQVRVSSIHGFKGLESDVVILVETDRLAESEVGQRLSYVALSRAKHHLIVIGQLPPPAA
jgi:hypothetical protein